MNIPRRAVQLSDLTVDVALSGVARGDILRRNSAGKWANLAVGGNLTRLGSNGTDPSWSAITSGEVTTGLGFTPANKAGDTFTGTIAQAGSAAIGGYLRTNSGNLSSTTNLNPGLLVYGGTFGVTAHFGLDCGYNAVSSRYRTRAILPAANGDFAVATGGTSPAGQSDFTDLFVVRGDTGAVGVGTVAPAVTAILDLTSTTRGFLPPRMTGTQRDAISSPPNGLILYNSSTDKLQVRAAGAWVDLH